MSCNFVLLFLVRYCYAWNCGFLTSYKVLPRCASNSYKFEKFGSDLAFVFDRLVDCGLGVHFWNAHEYSSIVRNGLVTFTDFFALNASLIP